MNRVEEANVEPFGEQALKTVYPLQTSYIPLGKSSFGCRVSSITSEIVPEASREMLEPELWAQTDCTSKAGELARGEGRRGSLAALSNVG